MICGISHIAKTGENIPEGYAFCETLPNNPLKFPFLSEPHETHTIAFYPGKPAIEIVKYPKLAKGNFLDSEGAVCIAMTSSNLSRDAESFSDCFTTGPFSAWVNKRHLMVQLFRTKGGEFIELVNVIK